MNVRPRACAESIHGIARCEIASFFFDVVTRVVVVTTASPPPPPPRGERGVDDPAARVLTKHVCEARHDTHTMTHHDTP